MKKIISILFIFCFIVTIHAQTITDGFMMPKNDFCTGFIYGFDRWSDYWEGTLKRDNLNIGTITTQSLTWVGVYGVSSKLNVIGMIPYVTTHASLGVLHDQMGLQDLSVTAKYRALNLRAGNNTIRLHGAMSFSTPLSRYTPDFLPLSIGLASTNLSWRIDAYYGMNNGFYVNGSGAYTWRSNIKLDRYGYFTNDQYYLSSELWMPNVTDFEISAGYKKKALTGELNFIRQITLGGGDIRKQDQPYASNRMNYSKVGLLLVYDVPKPKNFVVRAGAVYTLQGRNVGKSTSLMAGLLYTFHFSKTDSKE